MTNEKLFGEIIRFLIAGGTNTLIVYLVFAAMISVGFHYTMAALLAGIVGLVLGFRFLSEYVFNRKGWVLGYLTVFLIMYLTNIATQAIVLRFVYDNEYFSGFMAQVIVAIVSFVGNKKIVFLTKPTTDP